MGGLVIQRRHQQYRIRVDLGIEIGEKSMPARTSPSRFIPGFRNDSIDLKVDGARDIGVNTTSMRTKNPNHHSYPPVMKASEFPYVGMYACVPRKIQKVTHPRDASFLTQEAEFREWDLDSSERGDIGSSFMSIIPRFSEDGGDSCMCIAQTTTVDEDSISIQSSGTSTKEASWSTHSKLSAGVHFADEIGLPIQSVCHYDIDDSESSSPLSSPESPRSSINNSRQVSSRWDNNSCESWSPDIPKRRIKQFPRWDNPPCEPSNRWIRSA